LIIKGFYRLKDGADGTDLSACWRIDRTLSCGVNPARTTKPDEKSSGFVVLAVRTGLEPATHGVTGRYSNQLNYRTSILMRCKIKRIFSFAKQILLKTQFNTCPQYQTLGAQPLA
jgi:hypothetical protein